MLPRYYCELKTRGSEGIDYIALSLTGLGDKNDKMRQGTEFRRILQVISDAAAQKALQSDTPKVHVAYLLLRSQLSDLQGMVPLLANQGIE